MSRATGKIIRNMDTPESRAFWEFVDEAAREVATWPDWKRAGINVVQQLETSRPTTKRIRKRRRAGAKR